MQTKTEAETLAQDRLVASAPRRTRRKILLVALSALALAGAGGWISSARAAGPGGGEEMGEGMPMRRLHRILDSVDATPGQRDQIRAIWTGSGRSCAPRAGSTRPFASRWSRR